MGLARIVLATALMLYFTLSVALTAPASVASKSPWVAPYRGSRAEGRAPAIVGRALPAIAAPLVIQKVYASPVGELQFVASADRSTVFLRTAEGAICEMDSVEGEDACRHFTNVRERDVANVRCIFLFEKGPAACRHRIYSYELQESDLFRVVKSATRA